MLGGNLGPLLYGDVSVMQSKMKMLECYQYYMSFFFRRSRAVNSQVSNGFLPKFELIQAFIVVLVTCKNEDPIKNNELEC